MKLLILSIVITLCLSSYVDVLDENAFTEFENHVEKYLVGFFDDKNDQGEILTKFEKAAEAAQEQSLDVNFVRVNLNDNLTFKEKWKLEKFPTFYWVDSKKKIKENVTQTNFLTLVKAKLGLSKLDFSNLSLDNIKERQGNQVIVIKHETRELDETKLNALEKVMPEAGFSGIVITNARDLLEKFPETSYIYWDASNKLITPFELVQDLLEDETRLVDFLSSFRNPGYKKLGEEEMNIILEDGKPSLLLLYNNKTDSAEVYKFMTELSQKYKDKLMMFNSTLTNPIVSIITEVLAIKDNKLPFILITRANSNDDEDLEKFGVDKAELTKDSLERIINDYLENRLPKYIISEEIPAVNPDKNNIYKIVSKTFQEYLSQSDKDLVLVACTKLANKCSKFRQRLERVSQKLRENSHIMIAETDPGFNEYEDVFILQKYPSVFFIPAGEGDYITKFNNALIYEGDFTTKNLTEFIAQNSRKDITLRKLNNEEEFNKEEENDKIIPKANGDDKDFNFDEFFDTDMFKNMKFTEGEEVNKDDFKEFFKNMANGKIDGLNDIIGGGQTNPASGSKDDWEKLSKTFNKEELGDIDMDKLREVMSKKDDL